MHGLILIALAVFFAWQAGLKAATRLVTDRLPDDLANLVQHVVVGLSAYAALNWPNTRISQAMAVGGLVVLGHVTARTLGAHADAAIPSFTLRRDGRPPGFR